MDISTVTGSRVTADNVTSFYTFALGIVAGGFLVVGVGAFDGANHLGGDLMRTYLALITAMLGGGIGLFASRFGDRASDRRKVRRRANIAILDLKRLQGALSGLSGRLSTIRLKIGPTASPEDLVSVGVWAQMAARTAQTPPDFDELVETADDVDCFGRADRTFALCALHFADSAAVALNSESDLRSYLVKMQRDDTRHILETAEKYLTQAQALLASKAR